MLKKIAKPIGAIIFVTLLIFATLYLTSGETLPNSARINRTNVGGLNANEAAEKIIKNTKQKEVTVLRDDKRLGDVLPTYDFDAEKLSSSLSDIIKKHRLNLVLRYKLAKGYKVEMPVKNIGNKDVIKRLRKIDGNKYKHKTKNAYLNYDNFKIVKEVYGDNIDFVKLEKSFAKTVSKGKGVFFYKSNKFYEKPTILSDNKELKFEQEFAKEYLKNGIELKGETNVKISPKTLRELIVPTEDGAMVKEEVASKIIKNIKINNSTKNVTVTLQNKKVTLPNYGDLTKVDINKTANSLIETAKNKIKGVIAPGTIYYTYNNIDYTKNYVEVSISKQKLYYFKNGKMKMSCPVVTGSSKHFTPKGAFSVMWKERNTTLRGFEDDGRKYASKVSYWMPLNDRGVGLHDADWRYSFGGEIYKSNGSHGCVNMPPDKARLLFNNISEKYPVFIH